MRPLVRRNPQGVSGTEIALGKRLVGQAPVSTLVSSPLAWQLTDVW